MVEKSVLVELRAWLLEELKKHTEVDSDMLADYIVAILEVDADYAQLRENCMSSLEEILEDGKFAEDGFLH